MATALWRPLPVFMLTIRQFFGGKSVFVVAVLASLAMGWDIRLFLNAGMVAVAVLTAASGGLYLLEWVRHMANGQVGGGAP